MPNVNPILIRNYRVPSFFAGAAAIRLDDYYAPCWLVASGTDQQIVIGNSALDCASKVAVTLGISSSGPVALRLDRLVGVWALAYGPYGLITVIGVGPLSTPGGR